VPKRPPIVLQKTDARAAVFATITLPYLQPALIGAAAISFLMVASAMLALTLLRADKTAAPKD